MNKYHWKNREALSRLRRQSRIRREILLHAEELAGELNLRLLLEEEVQQEFSQDTFLRALLQEAGLADLWRELCVSGKILFVEELTVTEICFPTRQKTGLLMRLGRKAAALWAPLQKMLTAVRRLFSFSAVKRKQQDLHSIR